jgi:hypothetical protein
MLHYAPFPIVILCSDGGRVDFAILFDISFATTVLLSFSNCSLLCSDGGRVDYATLQKKLSPFQLEKLTYLFRCLFDCNQDGVIDVSFKDFNFKNYKKSPSELGPFSWSSISVFRRKR